jgi:hypothetical protein
MRDGTKNLTEAKKHHIIICIIPSVERNPVLAITIITFFILFLFLFLFLFLNYWTLPIWDLLPETHGRCAATIEPCQARIEGSLMYQGMWAHPL